MHVVACPAYVRVPVEKQAGTSYSLASRQHQWQQIAMATTMAVKRRNQQQFTQPTCAGQFRLILVTRLMQQPGYLNLIPAFGLGIHLPSPLSGYSTSLY